MQLLHQRLPKLVPILMVKLRMICLASVSPSQVMDLLLRLVLMAMMAIPTIIVAMSVFIKTTQALGNR